MEGRMRPRGDRSWLVLICHWPPLDEDKESRGCGVEGSLNPRESCGGSVDESTRPSHRVSQTQVARACSAEK